jgi:hypothetical protein
MMIRRSFARAVDILLQGLVWTLVLLDLMPHVIDTPFTGWLRSVHIFWWFLGAFVAWVAWKRLFCGGFSKTKTLGGKNEGDAIRN